MPDKSNSKQIKISIVEIDEGLHQTKIKLKCDDGAGDPYYKVFIVDAVETRQFTPEELIQEFKKRDLTRPVDQFKYVRDALNKEFVVEVEA